MTEEKDQPQTNSRRTVIVIITSALRKMFNFLLGR